MRAGRRRRRRGGPHRRSSASRTRRRRRGRSPSWPAAAGCSPQERRRSAISLEALRLHGESAGRSTGRGRSSLSASTSAATGAAPRRGRICARPLEAFERLGAGSWAERARTRAARERRDGTEARSQRGRRAHAAGASDRPLREPRARRTGGGRAAVPQPAHDRLPPAQDLHEARHLLAGRAHPQQRRDPTAAAALCPPSRPAPEIKTGDFADARSMRGRGTVIPGSQRRSAGRGPEKCGSRAPPRVT